MRLSCMRPNLADAQLAASTGMEVGFTILECGNGVSQSGYPRTRESEKPSFSSRVRINDLPPHYLMNPQYTDP